MSVGVADAERYLSGWGSSEALGAQTTRWCVEEPGNHGSVDDGATSGLDNADGRDSGSEREQRGGEHRQQPGDNGSCVTDRRPGPTNGFWGSADWLACRDGKWRPVEPGLEPLAHGLPARVGRLRGYGNAINPHAAAQFVTAFMESIT